MGWTVLYIAFGIVALWLLGEVLLQYKARLRWRLLAFTGFAAVVVGVVMLSSVIVITLGAMAFAVGQTFVTLSYRRGFSTGWALGGKPGSSRRRRGGGQAEDAAPVLEVSRVEEHDPEGHEPAGYDAQGYDTQGYDPQGYGSPAPPAYEPQQPPAYEPQPLPDDTGEYGVYDRGEQFSGGPESYPAPAAAPGYGYGPEEQHQYAAYTDPYAGQDSGPYAAPAAASYDAYGTYGGGVSFDPQGSIPQPPGYAPDPGPYSSDGYGTDYGTGDPGGQQNLYDPYAATAYGTGTPPEGVWVPQQRETEGALPPEQPYPYPYQDGYGDRQPDYEPQPYGYDTGQSGYYYDEQRGY